jgi:sensor histidine kinase YesM
MGDVCLKANRFNESILYLDSAISISLRLSDLHLAWYAYYNMIYAYQGLKDYKTALDYFWKYNSINDSILKKENSDKLSELQTKYQVENREIKILGLIKENAFNQEKINKENFEKKLLIFLVTLCLVIIVLITIGFLMKRHDNKLLKKQKRDIIDKTELLNKQSAEIAMYKAQMNPHFIFNAINSVQRFIVEKQTSLALEYISDLSKLIRATLNFSDKEYISIQEEIEYLQQYVRFEKLRCDNKFDFFVTIDKSLDIENVGILPMLIQPFIENSVKHGIIPKEGKGRIDLEIFKDNLAGIDILKIKITDDGIGLVASFSNKNIDIIHKSKGTEITQNRLKKLNEKYFSELTQYFNISVISNEDNTSGTKVEIVIPYIEIF